MLLGPRDFLFGMITRLTILSRQFMGKGLSVAKMTHPDAINEKQNEISSAI
jgi:hypothetical protein